MLCITSEARLAACSWGLHWGLQCTGDYNGDYNVPPLEGVLGVAGGVGRPRLRVVPAAAPARLVAGDTGSSSPSTPPLTEAPSSPSSESVQKPPEIIARQGSYSSWPWLKASVDNKMFKPPEGVYSATHRPSHIRCCMAGCLSRASEKGRAVWCSLPAPYAGSKTGLLWFAMEDKP